MLFKLWDIKLKIYNKRHLNFLLLYPLFFYLFFNTYVIYASDQTEDHVGLITAEQLISNYSGFDNTDDKQNLHQSSIDQLAALKTPYQISVFFGTWCHDSEREVPRLIDIVKATNNDNLQLTLISIDQGKKDPDGKTTQHNIKYTPTIIIEKNGKELGRIVEYPKKSLEEDIVALILEQSNNSGLKTQ